ncbi:agrin-like [Sarcoptes scabiei]|nr:agrin-like [Sarcoptes scabiei]
MFIEVIAFSKDTGIPLFIHRIRSNESMDRTESINSSLETQLNYSSVLYGIRQFGSLMDFQLEMARDASNQLKFRWFQTGKILLILYSNQKQFQNQSLPFHNNNDDHLQRLLKIICDLIRMICGENIFNLENFDLQKRNLKSALPYLNYLTRSFQSLNNLKRIDSLIQFTKFHPSSIGQRSKLTDSIAQLLNRFNDIIQTWALFWNDQIYRTDRYWWKMMSVKNKASTSIVFLITSILETDSDCLEPMRKLSIWLPNSQNQSNLLIYRIMPEIKLAVIIPEKIELENFGNELLANLGRIKLCPAEFFDEEIKKMDLFFEEIKQTITLPRNFAFFLFDLNNRIYLHYNQKMIEENQDRLIELMSVEELFNENPNHQQKIKNSQWCLGDRFWIFTLSNSHHSILVLYNLDIPHQDYGQSRKLFDSTRKLFDYLINRKLF